MFIFVDMRTLGYLLRQDLLSAIDDYALTELLGGRNAVGNIPQSIGAENLWKKAARTAIDTARLYISTWFNQDIELAAFFQHDVSTEYLAATRVATSEVKQFDIEAVSNLGTYYEESAVVYLCIQAAPVNTPVTDISFFSVFMDVPPEQGSYVGGHVLFKCIQDAPAGTDLLDTDFFEFRDNRNQSILYAVALLTVYMLHVRKNARIVPEQQIENKRTAMDMLKSIQKGTVNLEGDSVPIDEPTDSIAQKVVFGSFDDNQIY